MNFRLEFTPKTFPVKIKHSHKLFLAGSCFTEQIGNKLAAHKFRVIENPNGILFNPVSIAKSINSYVDNKQYTERELFCQDDVWGSWEHHTKFSRVDKKDCLQAINTSQAAAHHLLRDADWVLLTLGSAFVYELDNGEVVANCHKVPTDKFSKRLLEAGEVVSALEKMLNRLQDFNPNATIIFTISPVRHLRDGFVENNRSKATLINAVHQLTEKFQQCTYFPAYELVIDDLRDYRFFAEDMVHPNYAATNYVWEKFVSTCIDEASQLLMKDINTINAARSHKPFNPTSDAHKRFQKNTLEKIALLLADHPYLDFAEEKQYFTSA